MESAHSAPIRLCVQYHVSAYSYHRHKNQFASDYRRRLREVKWRLPCEHNKCGFSPATLLPLIVGDSRWQTDFYDGGRNMLTRDTEHTDVWEQSVQIPSRAALLNGELMIPSRAGIREVIVTDTVARSDELWPELRVVSIAPLIAAAIRRFMADGSLGDLR